MDPSPATGTTTRTTPYEKSAEFARLYYFFEKLTQPRSCGKSPNREWTPREAAADDTVPEDIAPLLKNLSAILTKDEPVHGDALEATFATTTTSPPPSTHAAPDSHASTTRPRRNTVAGSSTPQSAQPSRAVGQDHGVQARFPLREKCYPFTFKLLLHKLYDLEDWAAKVQQVLAASQEQFRSLNAAPRPVTGDGAPRSPGSPTGGTTTFSGSLFGTPPPILESPTRRQRALSVASKTKANDGARSGLAVARPPQPSRAVKKRIVNRRRSTSGLGVEKKGEWMYDAAVSSVDMENVDARGNDSLRRRKCVLSSVGFVEEERRPVGRDLTNASFYRRERVCTVKSQ
ncbi:hypothetical protein BJV78DRAFT_470261 [Lactifluus subvellereus]|nr:hypothetical protein BJV78DRAFT_470261 [Lactifluus subvellereus]